MICNPILSTRGHPGICVAVLDGPVDLSHSCFYGADLTVLPTLVPEAACADGAMSGHGTHVTSLIFGQPSTDVEGLASQCRGLLLPVFADEHSGVSQLDLARAIEQAVNAGAHIVNFSGGQLTDHAEAEGWLENALQLCKERNVLLVAAAGNDGCECLHVPAALPNVLAVGAMDARGDPLGFSNWGDRYELQGILAPGENILGAKPGGGTVVLSGTSFATPIVTGVAAQLLAEQLCRGEDPDPLMVREILIRSASPCGTNGPTTSQRCLAGILNPSGAYTLLTETHMTDSLVTPLQPSGCGCDGKHPLPDLNSHGPISDISMTSIPFSQETNIKAHTGLSLSQAPAATDSSYVYALGTLGYDFGTEARRDTFKQLMPPFDLGSGMLVPANPYDARQIVDYLSAKHNITEAASLIWTLNIELTPVYAIEPRGPFAKESYHALVELLAGQIKPATDISYIERVAIPGIKCGRTVKLFSGQVVPVIELQGTRSLYGWNTNQLKKEALEMVSTALALSNNEAPTREAVEYSLASFLNRIYYDLRNLGNTSQDRALNFAATNLVQAASAFAEAIKSGYQLDSINVDKSPFCRLDSDCWDVKLKFFNPDNNQMAKIIFRFTIDVSDLTPVTLGEVKSWTSPF